MKVHKLLCLDPEIADFISSKGNASGYVNELLHKAKENDGLKGLDVETLKAMKPLYEQKVELEKKLKELSNGVL